MHVELWCAYNLAYCPVSHHWNYYPGAPSFFKSSHLTKWQRTRVVAQQWLPGEMLDDKVFVSCDKQLYRWLCLSVRLSMHMSQLFLTIFLSPDLQKTCNRHVFHEMGVEVTQVILSFCYVRCVTLCLFDWFTSYVAQIQPMGLRWCYESFPDQRVFFTGSASEIIAKDMGSPKPVQN